MHKICNAICLEIKGYIYIYIYIYIEDSFAILDVKLI